MVALPTASPRNTPDERRALILGAAERVFARHGLHGATMADVAAEARMSQGNLYRYFRSKDDIIAAFAERDRAEIARDFGVLSAAEDLVGVFEGFLRQHCLAEPRERAVLMLEIWAEATRNPTLAHTCRSMEDEIRRHLEAFLTALPRAPAHIAAGQPVAGAVDLMIMLVDGYFRRRATDPAFDHVAATDHLLAAMRLLMGQPAGQLQRLAMNHSIPHANTAA
jgi:AcrR family transcriptional regulator